MGHTACYWPSKHAVQFRLMQSQTVQFSLVKLTVSKSCSMPFLVIFTVTLSCAFPCVALEYQ